MPECYVSLDKYKNDISRQVARDKLIIERCERYLSEFRSDSSCRACMNSGWILRFEMLVQMLKQPLDSWFTEQEWSHPISVCSNKHDKFSSVPDGVQTSWIDDIGENPYPNQVR